MNHPAFVPASFLLVFAALAPGLQGSAAGAQDKAAADFPDWRITPQVSAPRPIVVKGMDGSTRTLWYVSFTVKNDTGAARTLTPFVTLTTEKGGSHSACFDTKGLELVRTYEGKDAIDIYDLGGEIADGDTKKVIAMFDRVDPLANDLTVHYQGFAASLVRKGKDFIQQQVEYVAKYHRSGNEVQVLSAAVKKVSADWVTVSSKKIR
jgi:hypothetical protein